MATLNSAWNIATGALSADQAALNVTANNTSNVNTPGYTRQVAVWEENVPVTINGLTYGTGGSVTSISSQRDRVLEQSLAQQTQTQQSTETRLTALTNLEAVFADATAAGSNASGGGISSALSGFFSAASALEGDPGNNSLRETVLSAAGTLTQSFSGTVTELAQQQASIDTQSQTVITQVNALTSAIAGLNQQIQRLNPTTDAGSLEDQRQLDLNQLSKLVGTHQIQTENNGLTITTTGGALLVAEGTAYPITRGPLGGVTHYYDGAGADITASLASGGGQLGGLLTARDQDIPQALSALDALAGGLAARLNAVQESGVTPGGAAGTALFSIPAGTGLAGSVAGGITVVLTDPSLIAAAGAGKGPSDGSNAVALANVQNTPLITLSQPESPYQITSPASPTNFFADFVATLGAIVSETSSVNDAQKASLTQTQTQRDALSAVNQDEEASNLSLLERSYEASSKVFTILDTLFSSALNLGVESSVA